MSKSVKVYVVNACGTCVDYLICRYQQAAKGPDQTTCNEYSPSKAAIEGMRVNKLTKDKMGDR